MAVKKKHGGRAGSSPTRTLGGAASPTSSMGSPFHPTGASLHRFKTTGHSARSSGYDEDASDLEDPSTPPAPTASLIIRSDPVDHDDHHLDEENDVGIPHNGQEMRNKDDFSFAKPANQVRGGAT